MNRRVYVIFFFCLMFSPFSVYHISASTVLKIDFNHAVNGSELIFDGTVISEETRLSPINGKPFTYLTFKIIDVIKGSYASPTIEIGYMGGKVGEVTLIITDMRMPKIGERGIYFVESLSAQQIHPLIGWQQGHYLVITNPQTGMDVVVGADQKGRRARDSGAAGSLTVEAFKGNIRKAIEGDQ